MIIIDYQGASNGIQQTTCIIDDCQIVNTSYVNGGVRRHGRYITLTFHSDSHKGYDTSVYDITMNTTCNYYLNRTGTCYYDNYNDGPLMLSKPTFQFHYGYMLLVLLVVVLLTFVSTPILFYKYKNYSIIIELEARAMKMNDDLLRI